FPPHPGPGRDRGRRPDGRRADSGDPRRARRGLTGPGRRPGPTPGPPAAAAATHDRVAAMLRGLPAGEANGPAPASLLDVLPAGIEQTSAELKAALARRRLGHGRGSREKFEQDVLTTHGGRRHGLTLGSPLAIEIANSEWPKWEKVM